MSNVVAVCTGFCGLVLFTHLLRSGTLGGPSYTTLVIVTALTSLAISRIELLQVIDLKKMTLTLREIQQVRTDVYAKADLVRRMGEELADLVVFNVRSAGRFAASSPLETDQKLIAARDQVAQVLRDIGSDQRKIDDTVRPINEVVLFDLKREIVQFLNQRYNERLAVEPGIKLPPFQPLEAEFTSLVMGKNFDRHAIVELFKRDGLYDQRLEPILDRVEKFIREETL